MARPAQSRGPSAHSGYDDFLLLSGDYRVGAAGPYKFSANEAAIGLTIPRAAVEILRQRLTPADFNRAVTLAEPFSPDNAVQAGFLDRVVSTADLPDVARGTAEAVAALDMSAHLAAKLRARQHALSALRAAIDADDAEFRARIASGPGLAPTAAGAPSQ